VNSEMAYCIRCDENAAFETGLSSQLSSSSDCQESSLEGRAGFGERGSQRKLLEATKEDEEDETVLGNAGTTNCWF